MVATGELAMEPSIHLWDPVTLEKKGQIKGEHKNGIHLLQFID
jgi:hypothetical protein